MDFDLLRTMVWIKFGYLKIGELQLLKLKKKTRLDNWRRFGADFNICQTLDTIQTH